MLAFFCLFVWAMSNPFGTQLYGLCQRWWYTGPLFRLFKSTLPLYFTISDIVHVLSIAFLGMLLPDWTSKKMLGKNRWRRPDDRRPDDRRQPDDRRRPDDDGLTTTAWRRRPDDDGLTTTAWRQFWAMINFLVAILLAQIKKRNFVDNYDWPDPMGPCHWFGHLQM